MELRQCLAIPTSNVLIKSLAIAGDCACNSCFMTSLTSATGSRPGSVNGQASQRKTGFEEWCWLFLRSHHVNHVTTMTCCDKAGGGPSKNLLNHVYNWRDEANLQPGAFPRHCLKQILHCGGFENRRSFTSPCFSAVLTSHLLHDDVVALFVFEHLSSKQFEKDWIAKSINFSRASAWKHASLDFCDVSRISLRSFSCPFFSTISTS